jgi:hypothetical protein
LVFGESAEWVVPMHFSLTDSPAQGADSAETRSVFPFSPFSPVGRFAMIEGFENDRALGSDHQTSCRGETASDVQNADSDLGRCGDWFLGKEAAFES